MCETEQIICRYLSVPESSTVVAELVVDWKNRCMPNLMWGRGERTTGCVVVSYFPALL